MSRCTLSVRAAKRAISSSERYGTAFSTFFSSILADFRAFWAGSDERKLRTLAKLASRVAADFDNSLCKSAAETTCSCARRNDVPAAPKAAIMTTVRMVRIPALIETSCEFPQKRSTSLTHRAIISGKNPTYGHGSRIYALALVQGPGIVRPDFSTRHSLISLICKSRAKISHRPTK